MRIAALSALVGLACTAAPPPEPVEPASCPPAVTGAAAPEAASAPPTELREGFEVARELPTDLDARALAKLEARAEAEKSTALIVVHDGKLVRERYFGFDPGPQNAMSVTKSVVALLFGVLIDRERIALDEPLGERLFPEWKGKPAGAITLGHLLHQTSGIAPERFWQKKPQDFHGTIERHVLAGKLVSKPGERWAYNNNATDFLSVVARRAASEPGRPPVFLDDLLSRALLAKLAAGSTSWTKDGAGDPRVSGELWMRPMDLAKIGQLVLDRGTWRGERVVSQSFVDAMVAAGPKYSGYGYLWWRSGWAAGDFGLRKWAFPEWSRLGVHADVIAKLTPLAGTMWSKRDEADAALARALGGEAALGELQQHLWKRGRTLYHRKRGEVLAYRADGYLGQYIIVVPSKRLVAVRMRDGKQTSWNPEEYGYGDFIWDALAVAGHDLHPEDRKL